MRVEPPYCEVTVIVNRPLAASRVVLPSQSNMSHLGKDSPSLRQIWNAMNNSVPSPLQKHVEYSVVLPSPHWMMGGDKPVKVLDEEGFSTWFRIRLTESFVGNAARASSSADNATFI